MRPAQPPASDRFEHVGTAPDTTVNIDFDLAANCIDYLRQNRNGRWSGVQLPRAVVGNDNPGGTMVDGKQSII
jgi:hypothetical protein